MVTRIYNLWTVSPQNDTWIRTDAFHGSYQLNPYNFGNFDINFLSLFINGKQVPSQALQPIFDGLNSDYARCYLQMFSSLGQAFSNHDCGISYADYKAGNTFFVFNLNADLSEGEHVESIKRGTTRIEVRFGTALVNPITCLVLSEYDNLILIDADRNISLDYLV